MNYEQWLKLFGRAANDPDVAATVALAGISKNLAIATDELSVAADVPGQGLTLSLIHIYQRRQGPQHAGDQRRRLESRQEPRH